MLTKVHLRYPYRSAVSAGLFSLKVGVLLRLYLLLGHGSLPIAPPPGDGRPEHWPSDILCHTTSMRLAVAFNLLSTKAMLDQHLKRRKVITRPGYFLGHRLPFGLS